MFSKSMAKFWISTIKYHDSIVRRIALYSFVGAYLMIFLSIGGVLSLPVALNILLLYGVFTMLMIWGFCLMRRNGLKRISDPELRIKAHLELLRFLARRKDKLTSKDILKLKGIKFN